MPPRATTAMTPRAMTSGLVRLAPPGWAAGWLLRDSASVERLLDRFFLLGSLLDDLELEDLRELDFVTFPPYLLSGMSSGRSKSSRRWAIIWGGSLAYSVCTLLTAARCSLSIAANGRP